MTLIERTNCDPACNSFAIYSECERYRYLLSRTWEAGAPRLLYIMLNPSTATELANDPTIERCERRARQLGFGTMVIANLFAWRATSPTDLKVAKLPIGSDTLRLLSEAAEGADTVLVAWGVHGEHQGQALTVSDHLRSKDLELHCLGTTKNGHPRHPLYVSYATDLQVWTGYNSD